jgi:hypothetical protein
MGGSIFPKLGENNSSRLATYDNQQYNHPKWNIIHFSIQSKRNVDLSSKRSIWFCLLSTFNKNIMKHFLHLSFLLLSFHCLGQALMEPLDKRTPNLIIQTGIGFQWLGDGYKLYTLSAERPSGFWHWGMQGTFYLDNSPTYYYYSGEFLGGFEMSVFSKYFLHGRFSGRKSGLFLGPELSVGVRRFQIITDIFFPPNPNYIPYEEHVTKALLRWGVQWQFGHATLEFASPFGVEIFKSKLSLGGYSNGNETQFVLMPSLQLGFAF